MEGNDIRTYINTAQDLLFIDKSQVEIIEQKEALLKSLELKNRTNLNYFLRDIRELVKMNASEMIKDVIYYHHDAISEQRRVDNKEGFRNESASDRSDAIMAAARYNFHNVIFEMIYYPNINSQVLKTVNSYVEHKLDQEENEELAKTALSSEARSNAESDSCAYDGAIKKEKADIIRTIGNNALSCINKALTMTVEELDTKIDSLNDLTKDISLISSEENSLRLKAGNFKIQIYSIVKEKMLEYKPPLINI